MPRPILQILLAFSLVLAANYFWWDPRTAPAMTPAASDPQEALPRTYIKGARSWSFNKDGQLTDIIEALLIEQFPKLRPSRLTEPRFYSHSEDDKTWSASAKRGLFFHGTERLILRDSVVLNHDQSGTRMNTKAMDIYLKSRSAESRRKVTITRDQDRTTADGMVANLDLETIQLKPNVESIYVKPPEPALP